MSATQPGLFALGTRDHSYLEFDLRPEADPEGFVRAACAAVADLTTTGGVDVVLGVRPSLWARTADAADVPADVEDFDDPVVGPDGITMPATQHDAWLWIAGADRTPVFDAGRTAVAAVTDHAVVATETTGWHYGGDRDLTGFIDGTENPHLLDAPGVVAIPDGRPGAGASVLLFQLWRHHTDAWEAQGTERQEQAMGRTKADSTEFPADRMPADAHVARTKVHRDGEELDIFRRNVAYGGLGEHGTVFVGFAADQFRMAQMLRQMAGVGDGIRCALTRYVTALTGAWYVVPSVQALRRIAPAPADD